MLIDADTVAAIEQWMIVQMKENHGPARRDYDGDPLQPVFGFSDMIHVLNDVCPDVVGRMLQAGAANYLPGGIPSRG